MRIGFGRTAVAGVAFALMVAPATAQTKVATQGISDNEIVVGSHQDLSGPVKVWGVSVANGMRMAVDEINAAGGIHGRKLRLIIEDSGYDPKRAVLATQKLIEKDRVFSMLGSMGSPTVLAAQDIVLDAGITQLFPLTAAEFTFKIDPAKPQERLKFANLLPYVESTRAAVKYLVDLKRPQKPCLMHQDDEYGKNVLDGFTAQLAAMKQQPGTITTFKRGATDFSAQVARMKSDGCDLVVLGTVVRETIGAMGEAKKLGWSVTFLGALPIRRRRQHPGDRRLQRDRHVRVLRQSRGQGPHRAKTPRRPRVGQGVSRPLQLAAGEILQDQPSAGDHHPGAAGAERPLGGDQGRADVLMMTCPGRSAA